MERLVCSETGLVGPAGSQPPLLLLHSLELLLRGPTHGPESKGQGGVGNRLPLHPRRGGGTGVPMSIRRTGGSLCRHPPPTPRPPGSQGGGVSRRASVPSSWDASCRPWLIINSWGPGAGVCRPAGCGRPPPRPGSHVHNVQPPEGSVLSACWELHRHESHFSSHIALPGRKVARS